MDMICTSWPYSGTALTEAYSIDVASIEPSHKDRDTMNATNEYAEVGIARLRYDLKT